MTHPKQLAVAIDYPTNMVGHEPSPGRHYTPAELDSMFAWYRELGVRRVYWFFGTHRHIYERPYGSDPNLLHTAVRLAQAHGLQVHAVIKPFETGQGMQTIPPHLEPPSHALRSVQGWHPFMPQFVADHPQYRLKFAPRQLTSPGDGRVHTVKLVAADDRPVTLTAADVAIYWSKQNSQYRLYEGPRTGHSLGIEDRDGRACQVLTISGLELPEEARYILLRFLLDGDSADFINTPAAMLELWDNVGPIPSQGDMGPVRNHKKALLTDDICYPQATRAVLSDDAARNAAYNEHFAFDCDARKGQARAFNQPGGYVCHSLNFNSHCSGGMHPCYPEVRDYWLSRVQAALNAGVDGVALRISNHSTWTAEPERLGYNEPALAEYARRANAVPRPGDIDLALLRAVNGDYYTTFLRSAAAVVRAAGKSLEHFAHPISEGLLQNVINNVPATFHFDLRGWLREGLIDGICMRPMSDPRTETYFGDYLGSMARYFGVTCYYANRNGLMRQIAYNRPVPDEICRELKRVYTSRLYDGFILYEASDIMGFDETGRMHACEAMRGATADWREAQPNAT